MSQRGNTFAVAGVTGVSAQWIFWDGKPMKHLLLAMIAIYRYAISPMLGRRCRFWPSCSEYAAAALRKHGAGKGAWLAINRLCRCHPWNPGGFDPVP